MARNNKSRGSRARLAPAALGNRDGVGSPGTPAETNSSVLDFLLAQGGTPDGPPTVPAQIAPRGHRSRRVDTVIGGTVGRAAGEPTAACSSDPAEPDLPSFRPEEVLRRYLAGDHDAAFDLCGRTLNAYTEVTIAEVKPETKRAVNAFVETFLYLLTRPEVVLSRQMTRRLLGGHHVFANLVAISDFGTTDPQLSIVCEQGGNFGKVLFLYSVYNTRWIDPKQFFDADPELASMWYTTFDLGAVCLVSEHDWNTAIRHLNHIDERLCVPDHRVTGMVFRATYVNDDQTRVLKSRFNHAIQRQIGNRRAAKVVPVRNRVAVISGKWYAGTAVHRSMSPLVETLRDGYRMTLVTLGELDAPPLTDGFAETRSVVQRGRIIDCNELQETDFQVAFYPDVGMTKESIWLSNMRLAPIQVTGYGHPTTTAGSQIDYFIGGAEVELPKKARDFYTERLVLIPGLAAVPLYPAYDAKYPETDRDRIIVNLPWSVAKINYPMMKVLRAIEEQTARPVTFQFFPGSGLDRYSAVPKVMRDLGSIFGKSACVYGQRAYLEYMEIQERGHFTLDSHPFGGYNTIIDSLHLGKPIVTLEGERFYNRASSALLRRVGLDELIAHSPAEYVAKAVRLANDDGYREEISQQLRETDLDARIFRDDSTQYFRKAIDYLIEHHERLQREPSREPIFIT